MRILVDRDRCEGHGQCVAAAPDVFDLDEDGIAVLRTPDALSADLAEAAAAAAEVCPVAALALEANK